MMKKHHLFMAAFAALAAGALLVGCAMPQGASPAQDAATLMRASFSSKGIASVERLKQDETQRICSTEQAPSDADAARLIAQAQAGVKLPPDGRYLGDWREGEKLAQNGRGMTWSDAFARPADNGGSCYNCHQITKQEVAFGNIGPSLLHYGRLRGVTDPASEASEGVVRYTWQKLWDSHTYSACSFMPRYGQQQLLDMQQLRNLMALLLDPKSPVNAD